MSKKQVIKISKNINRFFIRYNIISKAYSSCRCTRSKRLRGNEDCGSKSNIIQIPLLWRRDWEGAVLLSGSDIGLVKRMACLFQFDEQTELEAVLTGKEKEERSSERSSHDESYAEKEQQQGIHGHKSSVNKKEGLLTTPVTGPCSLSPVSSDGKRHVLPISLLMQITQFVRQHAPDMLKEIQSSPVVDDGDLPVCVSRKASKSKKTSKKKNGHTSEEPPDYKDKSRQKRKRTDSSKSQGSPERNRKKKKRPNYFVSVQITDPEIRETAEKIQSHIVEHSKTELSSCMEGVHKSHITLMVMHLASEEEIERASTALDLCAASVRSRTDGHPIQLEVEGVNVFNGGRVFFACVKRGTKGLRHLHFLADEVRRQMADVGINTTDPRPFNPHITIAKGRHAVTEDLYSSFKDQRLGSQKVSSLQLCSMMKKREDGYYFVDHESAFV